MIPQASRNIGIDPAGFGKLVKPIRHPISPVNDTLYEIGINQVAQRNNMKRDTLLIHMHVMHV